MRFMMTVLGILVMLTALACSGGTASDGDASDGDAPDGDVPDGDAPDGDEDGDAPDGDEDGDAPDGDEDGDAPDGDEDGDAECVCTTTDTCCDGCLPRNESEPCDDGEFCTLDTICLTGVCAGGVTNTCEDNDPCTTDYCANSSCYNDWNMGCEDCGNFVDDNGNFQADCDDLLCQDDPACAGFPQGDTCRDPFFVNDGDPVGLAQVGQSFVYTGDTTLMGARYEGLCSMADLGPVKDAVYRLVLSVPLVVTATHDFDGDAEESPWSVLYVFGEHCDYNFLMECEWGEAGAAEISRTFPAGTYYFIVDGVSQEDQHEGPYTVTFDFAAPPATETDCENDIDDDGDGLTDCMDPNCYAESVCAVCPVVADLQCGDTIFQTFLAADEAHFYTFKTATAANISVTLTKPGDALDQYNINFKEGPITQQRGCQNLLMLGDVDLWHTTNPNAAGFTTTANADYVAKINMSQFDQGHYTLSYQCGTDPESQCNDEQDNDVDLLVDCEDPDCFTAAVCTGGYAGNTCADAFRINGGNGIGLADLGENGFVYHHYNTTLNKSNTYQAACAPVSNRGPDAVYRFTLTDTLDVGVMIEFADLKRPALYLFSGTCTTQNLVGCGESYWWIGYIGQVLDPGTYYLVVDSGGLSPNGVADASHYEIEFYFDPPPEEEKR